MKKKWPFFLFSLVLLATLSACSVKKDPEKLVDDAIKDGYYVNIHGEISNKDVLPNFIGLVETGQDAQMSMITYTIEGDPIIDEYMKIIF